MTERWLLGLDLGQAEDFSALAGVQQVYQSGVWTYHVRHLHRWDLGTSYVRVVDDVAALVDGPPLRGCTLLVDSTGVGRPVVDMTRQRNLPCQVVPCTITGGAHSSCDQNGWSVSKRELVSTLNVVLGQARFKVAESLTLARVLESEFGTFRARITPTGHEELSAPWREGSHDDVLFAVSLCTWYGERRPPAAAEEGPVILTAPRCDPFSPDWGLFTDARGPVGAMGPDWEPSDAPPRRPPTLGW
jgi:hypothetical protein